ncbi:MAG: tetratricopeptide repeat protein [Candidatus Krumholzibacteriota bacterium]|nr:tetratricopeptide repeat protein [Candidatus Krumholzibacteriota bacterium]
MRLIECYAHPLVGREDAARAVWRRARGLLPAPEDSLFLTGLNDLFIDRDYAGAATRLKLASRTEVSHPDAAYYLALAFFHSGHPAKAESIIEDLLSQDHTEGHVLELSVRGLVASGDMKEAQARARDLTRLYAEEPFPYVLLSLVELASGRFESAEQFCNNALVLDPRYIPAIVCRADLYVRSGELEAARVSFEKLLLFDDPILRAIGHEGLAYTSFHAGEFGRGVDAMDEAVRNAMLSGAVRRGLAYAASLVNYLCELGEAGAANDVVERWMTGFGEIPETLGRLRIDVLSGRHDHVRRALGEVEAQREWLVWSRVLAVDAVELTALNEIGESRFRNALASLEDSTAGSNRRARDIDSRRAFLRGYALFESGEAESARDAFASVRSNFYTVEFPYRGDPVLYVQSLFYLAECALAAGDESGAIADYRAFLESWGEAVWELRAVERARKKLQSLEGNSSLDESSGNDAG